jgi:hypothetical protein
MRRIALFSLIAGCVGLTACETRVNVEAAASTSAQFSSVLVTVKEIWFSENAAAAPDDASWLRFPLAEPQTLELVDVDRAAVSEVASELDVPPGTYRQIRLFLVDRLEPLTQSARLVNATFNDQVTFVDANGVEDTVPLELPDAAHGIGIETELVVAVPNRAIFAALAAASSSSTASTNARSTLARGATLSGTGSTAGSFQSPGLGTAFTTVPGGTQPSTTAPGATPATGMPGTTTPGASAPIVGTSGGSNVPSATVPTPTVPGTAIQGSSMTSPVAPGTTTPGTTTPGTTAPGMTQPSPSPSANASGIDTRSITVTSSVFFDAARDLAAFRFSDRPGFLLNPSLTAHDLDEVGNIQGALGVSSIVPNASTGRIEVEVTAEELNADSNRRVKVASAPVRSDGTFTLYPLPLKDDADGATAYDLVIHGPAVTTVVIRGVPVTEGPPGAGANVALDAITLIGSGTYAANVAAGGSVAPRGGRVQFYQTLADDEAPFIVAERPVDPLTGRLANDERLSAAPVVVYGTLGSELALIAAAPREGAASYSIAAFALLYGYGDFARAPLGPPTPSTSTATFTVPEIAIREPAAAGTIAATVTTATPGKYDNGALLVTHDGAVVTSAPLATTLSGPQVSTVVDIANVPSGSDFELGLYYLEAWAWSSADPEGSFTRQPVSAAVDLRGASAASADVAVD